MNIKITAISSTLLAVFCLCSFTEAQTNQATGGAARQPAAATNPSVRQPVASAAQTQQPVAATIPGTGNEISATTSDPNSLDSLPEVRDGLELLRTGDREGASVKFAQAYQKRPDLTPAGVAVAVALFNNKQFSEVRYWLEKTVETCPNDPETYIILAEVAQAEGRFTEAKMLTEAGTKLASAYKDNNERRTKLGLRARLVLAMIAEKKGKFDEAQKHLETIINASPEADYFTRLAVVQFQQDDLKSSLDTFGKAIEKGAQLPPPYALLAQLLDQKNKQADAKKYIDAAVQRGADDYKVVSVAAHLYTKWGLLPQAKSFADKALSLKPDAIEAKQMCGLIALYDRRYADAQKYYENVLTQTPNDFGAGNGLALALCEQGDPQKVAQSVNTAKQLAQGNPNSIDALSTLAWTLFKAGEAEQAEQLLLRVRSTGVMSATGAYYLAEILQARGDNEQAKALADVSLSTDNNYPKKSAAVALQKKLQ